MPRPNCQSIRTPSNLNALRSASMLNDRNNENKNSSLQCLVLFSDATQDIVGRATDSFSEENKVIRSCHDISLHFIRTKGRERKQM